MFLKLNMNPISNNLIDVAESPIWNGLISSRLELPNDIVDFDNNKIEENDDDDDDDDDEDNDLSPMLSKVKKLIICVVFKPFNFHVQ